MGLMRGSLGFWRVEKSSPARITVGMGRTILCVFLSFMLGGIYIRVVLGNEILLTNTNSQCKGSKNLIIEAQAEITVHLLKRGEWNVKNLGV